MPRFFIKGGHDWSSALAFKLIPISDAAVCQLCRAS